MNRYDPGLNNSDNYYDPLYKNIGDIPVQKYDKYTVYGVVMFVFGMIIIALPIVLPMACE